MLRGVVVVVVMVGGEEEVGREGGEVVRGAEVVVVVGFRGAVEVVSMEGVMGRSLGVRVEGGRWIRSGR